MLKYVLLFSWFLITILVEIITLCKIFKITFIERYWFTLANRIINS